MGYRENIVFRISFKFVHIVASWPKSGRSAVRDTFLVLFIVSVIILALVIQVLLLTKYNVDLLFLIEVVPPLSTLTGSTFLLPILISKCKYLEEMRTLMQNDGKEQRTYEEIQIKKRWFRRGETMATFFLACSFLAIMACIMSSFVAPLEDLLIPLNESRTKKLPFLMDPFVDEQKYFYWLMLYTAITCNTVIFFLASVAIVVATVANHVCGMFGVVGYKLENVMYYAENFVQNGRTNLEEAVNHTMKVCVEEHCKTLRVAKLLCFVTDDTVFLYIVAVILIMSISLVDVTSMDSFSSKPVALTVGLLFHFYMINYMGQDLIDSSSKIFWHAYNSNWYDYPVMAQKSLLVLMTKSFRYCSVNAKGFAEISIINFSMVLQITISYCLALRKLQ